jgi:hypothetical protein
MFSVARRLRAVPTALLCALTSLSACNRAEPVPEFVSNLPSLAASSSQHDSAMEAFTRDLEAWAAQAGRPSSAAALIGPLFLRSSPLHSMPAAADTGLEAAYQRLEVRFAELLRSRDSLSRAGEAAREQVLAWAEREATAAGEHGEEFRTPIFPPAPYITGQGGTVAAAVKCSLITVTVLPSKEGVRICVLKQKLCKRMPADDIGDAWWMVTCLQSCFDYIGWVPEGGGFTIGAK